MMIRWPATLLRGALLAASEDLIRFERAELDPSIRLEFAGAREIIDRSLPFVTDSQSSITVKDGVIRVVETQPLGSVLIVSAPHCASGAVIGQAIAALVAGNRLAISHHRTLGRVARVVLDSLQRSAPYGVLLQFEDEPFRLDWAHISIVVLTPTRVFLNDTPWVSWEFDSETSNATSDVIDFYRRHRITSMTWEISPVNGRTLPELEDRGLRPALKPEFAQ